MYHPTPAIEKFVLSHKEETLSLLKKLAVLPAPSHQEEQRGRFCLEWLHKQGATEAYIDEAGNVLFPYPHKHCKSYVLFSAHMDVVFPDLLPFSLKETPERLFAPGIGDDTANLVNLLMGIKYLLSIRPPHSSQGILFAANTCEEGLGNLKGIRQIFQDYGNSIQEMISFDLYLNHLVTTAVGSKRYDISVQTEGGHSYEDFGNLNAIYVLSQILQKLYEIPVPPTGKTTYNVGIIEGGTSINTIAQSAHMYYEFRSEQEASLTHMEEQMQQVIKEFHSSPAKITLSLLGERPCASETLSLEKMNHLIKRYSSIMEAYTGKPVHLASGSTDANIPLSLGIPALTIGTVAGQGLHTYEEWIEKDSLIPGQMAALAMIAQYFRK